MKKEKKHFEYLQSEKKEEMEKWGRWDAMGHTNILQKCGRARREGGLSWRAGKSSQKELDHSEHPQPGQ